ncbi:hypothetical protein [Methanobrevibacter sp.]|uniref:hypothetical protein n=1 Tax=Methanobrevibacter sp. TaxID=66852 RepID=UPI0038904F0C
MPYDYYDYFKKQTKNRHFTEVSDIVKEKIWSEGINFKLSLEWLKIEDKIRIKLYQNLRYN